MNDDPTRGTHPVPPPRDRGERETALRHVLVATVESSAALAAPRPSRRTIAGAIGLVALGAVVGGSASAAAAALSGDELRAEIAGPLNEIHTGEIAAFERPRAAEDRLPSGIPDYGRTNIDDETSRLAGELDGVSYYIVQGADHAAPLCLAASTSAEDWMIGCSGLGLEIFGPGVGIPAARLDAVDAPVPDGWIRLDENVIVAPAPADRSG